MIGKSDSRLLNSENKPHFHLFEIFRKAFCASVQSRSSFNHLVVKFDVFASVNSKLSEKSDCHLLNSQNFVDLKLST